VSLPEFVLGEELARSARRRVLRTSYGDVDAVTRVLTPRDAVGRVPASQGVVIRNAVLRGIAPAGVVDVAMRDTLDGYGVRALRLGESPRWPRALDAGVLASGEIYITTAWMEGETLASRIDSLTEAERRRAIVEVAGILEALHACGVAHGDLKATNLVWDPVRGVAIIDLDTLRFLGDAFTAVNTTDQTLNWSAPEQQSERLTYLGSDVWAWAVLAERAYPQGLPEQLQVAVSACANPSPQRRPTAASLVSFLTTSGGTLQDAWGTRIVPAPYRAGSLVVASVGTEPAQTERGLGEDDELTDRSPLQMPEATQRAAEPWGGEPSAVGAPQGSVRASHPWRWLAWVGGVLAVALAVVALRPEEVQDGEDNDWDGVVDEGTAAYDDDGDGFSEQAGDCDDASPARSPTVAERCATSVDDNCNGTANEEGAEDGTLYYYDEDGDGYGADGTVKRASSGARRRTAVPDPRTLCAPVQPFTATRRGDCYDLNGAAHPGAREHQEDHRGDGSFDYDCDGTEEPRDSEPMTCRRTRLGEYSAAGMCTIGQEGWFGGVPGCGESGIWGFGSGDCRFVVRLLGASTCEPSSPRGRRVQTCK